MIYAPTAAGLDMSFWDEDTNGSTELHPQPSPLQPSRLQPSQLQLSQLQLSQQPSQRALSLQATLYKTVHVRNCLRLQVRWRAVGGQGGAPGELGGRGGLSHNSQEAARGLTARPGLLQVFLEELGA